MKEPKEKTQPTKPPRTVREIIDEEFMTIGDDFGKIWTREELKDYHRIGDIIAELMAEGCSDEKFDAELERRILQAGLAGAESNGTPPRTTRKSAKPQAALNKAS